MQNNVQLESRAGAGAGQGDPRAVRSKPNQVRVAARPRREALRADVQRLEEVGLPRAVGTHDEHKPRLQLQLELGVGAVVPDENRAADPPANRMGMSRYRKFAHPSAWRTPGRKGLISRKRTVSPATDSIPSRRNSALKPISSGSPTKETGSDSSASPTSCVRADTVSSPSAKRSRSGEFRCAITAMRRTTSSASSGGSGTSCSKLSGISCR